MTDKAEVTKREGVEKVAAPMTDAICVPEVDIRECGGDIHLRVNLPGIDEKSVDVSVEGCVLTIEGKAWAEAPAGYMLVGQEYGVGRFRRDFTLSERMDTGNIKARMKHGVLDLVVPKREAAKARKIQIAS